MRNTKLCVVTYRNDFLSKISSVTLLRIRNSCYVVALFVTISQQKCYVMFRVPSISKSFDFYRTRDTFVAKTVTYVTSCSDTVTYCYEIPHFSARNMYVSMRNGFFGTVSNGSLLSYCVLYDLEVEIKNLLLLLLLL